MTRQPPFSGFIPTSLKLPRRDGVLADASLQLPDLAGRTIAGRYRVVVALGQGAVCTTYRARDLESDRDVALKVLDNHRFPAADRERAHRRFIQDARAAIRLQHPNIAETYAAGIDGGLAHVASELLAGGRDLAALVDEHGPLPWPRALPILMQICDALEAAHSTGTIHGALHPCYCYVTGDSDFVQVRDFGLSRVLDELQADSEADRMPVNPEYTAPELIRGGTPSQQTDIYACGVVMYKLLTGTVPFKSRKLAQLLSMQLLDTPIPPRRLLPDAGIPRGADEVVMSALYKEPDGRYQTVRELRAALAGADTGSTQTKEIGSAGRKKPSRVPARRTGIDSLERLARLESGESQARAVVAGASSSGEGSAPKPVLHPPQAAAVAPKDTESDDSGSSIAMTVLLAIVAVGLVAWVLMSSTDQQPQAGVASRQPGPAKAANQVAPPQSVTGQAGQAGQPQQPEVDDTTAPIAATTTGAQTTAADTGADTTAATADETGAGSEQPTAGDTEDTADTAGTDADTSSQTVEDSGGGAPATTKVNKQPDKPYDPNDEVLEEMGVNSGGDDEYDPNDENLEELAAEQEVADWGKRVAQRLKPYRSAARECGKQNGLARETLINVRLMLDAAGKIVRILPGNNTADDAAFACVKDLIKDVRFAEKRSSGNVSGGVFEYSFKVY